MIKKCKVCGYSNITERHTCHNCGRVLASSEPVGYGAWISVSDRLPEPHEREGEYIFRKVLIWSPDACRTTPDGPGVPLFGYYIHSAGVWKIEGSPSEWKITHWMPLPDAP